MADIFEWQACVRCGCRRSPENMSQSTAGPVCGICNHIALTGLPERMLTESIEAGFSSLRATVDEWRNR